MKKLSVYFSIFILISTVIACSKKPPIPPDPTNKPIVTKLVPPKTFMPAYPGSYWIYNDSDTLKTANSYQTFELYSNPPGNVGNSLIAKYNLPALNGKVSINNMGTNFFIKGYFVTGGNARFPGPTFMQFLTEEENDFFTLYSYRGMHIVGKTIKADTSIVVKNKVYNNTLITLQSYGYDVSEEMAHLREFYAKDIGLIRRDKKTGSKNWKTVLELTDFYINK